MIDPLREFVALLEPGEAQTKSLSAAGSWRVPRSARGYLFFCVMLEGACRIEVDAAAHDLLAGDFALVPCADDVTLSSSKSPGRHTRPVPVDDGAYRVGAQVGPLDMRSMLGFGRFGSPDAALLLSLLPRILHVRGEKRFTTLVQLLADESRSQRPARSVVLSRLLEVMFIDALRCAAPGAAPARLVGGLADERLAAPIRQMHADPARSWTVDELAQSAALSRSAFYDRFQRIMGAAPMEYLLAWRMALAKRLLRTGDSTLEDVASQVGYHSARAFSVAFTRHVGLPPRRFARGRPIPTRDE